VREEFEMVEFDDVFDIPLPPAAKGGSENASQNLHEERDGGGGQEVEGEAENRPVMGILLYI
jgi:hypothetical protein